MAGIIKRMTTQNRQKSNVNFSFFLNKKNDVCTLFLYHSTMSSCLNALSAVTWEDICKPLIGHKVSESQRTWIIKGLGMVIMFCFLICCFVMSVYACLNLCYSQNVRILLNQYCLIFVLYPCIGNTYFNMGHV